MVSLKLNSTFLVLPDPTPYSESESLYLYRHFVEFLLAFLRVFSSLSNFLLNCAKFCLARLVFFLPFLGGMEIGFLISVPFILTTILGIVCSCAPPCFLHMLQCFLLVQALLGTLAIESVPGCFLPFLPLVEAFLEDSILPLSWVLMRSIALRDVRSKLKSIGLMPFLWRLYWSCHWTEHILGT
jgi:hypothetical protein